MQAPQRLWGAPTSRTRPAVQHASATRWRGRCRAQPRAASEAHRRTEQQRHARARSLQPTPTGHATASHSPPPSTSGSGATLTRGAGQPHHGGMPDVILGLRGQQQQQQQDEGDPAPGAMVAFLTAYGLQPADVERVRAECPQLFCSAGSACSTRAAAACEAAATPPPPPKGGRARGGAACCGDVYEVGRTLAFFHSLGWSHGAVMRRIVPYYPQILTKQVERDLLPVLAHLAGLGCSEADVRLLVWENPRLFLAQRDWRRHIRQFQFLGLYGLPPPGHAGGGGGGAASLERLMHHLR